MSTTNILRNRIKTAADHQSRVRKIAAVALVRADHRARKHANSIQDALSAVGGHMSDNAGAYIGGAAGAAGGAAIGAATGSRGKRLGRAILGAILGGGAGAGVGYGIDRMEGGDGTSQNAYDRRPPKRKQEDPGMRDHSEGTDAFEMEAARDSEAKARLNPRHKSRNRAIAAGKKKDMIDKMDASVPGQMLTAEDLVIPKKTPVGPRRA